MVIEMSNCKPHMSIRAALIAAAAVSCLVVGTSQLSAANSALTGSVQTGRPDPGAMVQPQRVETILNADDNQSVFARAGNTRDALGFPTGVKRTGRHVKDAFLKAEYDEVDEIDSAGQPLSLTEFDGSGRLTAAVRFDMPTKPAARLTGEAARRTAQRALTLAGVTFEGTAQVEATGSSDGWDVHWSRSLGGVPIRGDETRVRLSADGRVESVAHVQHALAAEPKSRLDSQAARRVVSKTAEDWFASRGSGYDVLSVDLQWVDANAAFDPNGPADTQAPYRLAWVANVKPSGAMSDYLRLVTLYVDAATGSIIGGDVIE